MNNVRIQALQKFIEEDPKDPFNYYALAMEYQLDEPAKAGQLFDHILLHHPDYLPVYYSAGILFADLGDDDKARQILMKGLSLASLKSDIKTFREIQNAFNNLVD